MARSSESTPEPVRIIKSGREYRKVGLKRMRINKPLEGIRVIEWGTYYAAPGASAIMGDMGAEVIKIEQPIIGDPFRNHESSSLEIADHEEVIFLAANRGKKSITIDLARTEGREIAHRLVKKSDVFLTNLRRSTVTKMNMDYTSLSKVNPRLVYASVTAYGTKGPDSNKGGFDPNGQGRSGLMYPRRDCEPNLVKPGIVDHSTAIMASYQVIVALLMRERLGFGQEVDVSLLGTAFYLNYIANLHTAFVDSGFPDDSIRSDALCNHYRCQDGKWLILRARAEVWPSMCENLGHPELAGDSRFSSPDGLSRNAKELITILERAFAAKRRDEWLRLLTDGNVFICAVNTPSEAFVDPQMVENDYILPFEHPVIGKMKVPGFPIHFGRGLIESTMVAPKMGEHTNVVLKEIAGYSDDEIDHLRKVKAV